MGATELTYDEALRQEDKRAVEAIDARTAATLDRIGDFPRLRSLELSGNRNITDFAFLGQLPELRKLYLADIGLTAIPEPVAELAQLETLFIGKNAIADFSPLARLPRLVDLGLEEMGLRKIPDAVIALDGLKVLGLFGNSIASIAALKKLPQLEELEEPPSLPDLDQDLFQEEQHYLQKWVV